MKNTIFGLKKRQDFWTEIILFSTFQVHGIESPVKLNPNKSVDLDSGKYRIHCDVCDRTFSCVGNLKAHMANVHDANKVHKCEFCDKSFHQSVQLNDHIKQNHGGPKKYKCDFCEKTFGKSFSKYLFLPLSAR